MTKKDILDYVMKTPQNTNRAVLSGMLDNIENSDKSDGESTKTSIGNIEIEYISSGYSGKMSIIPFGNGTFIGDNQSDYPWLPIKEGDVLNAGTFLGDSVEKIHFGIFNTSTGAFIPKYRITLSGNARSIQPQDAANTYTIEMTGNCTIKLED